MVAALALAGCDSTDEPEQEEPRPAVTLPDNLCAVVSPTFVAAWDMEETAHVTSNGVVEGEASCEMAGRRDGAPATLVMTVTGFGDSAEQRAEAISERALADACDQAGAEPGTTMTRREEGFCVVGDEGPTGSPSSRFRDISLVRQDNAVAVFDLSCPKCSPDRVEYDVSGIGSSLLSEGLAP